MDQSARYSDLSLKEEDLIKGGRHILVAYKMKPKAGFGSYLQCAAHFAAESSTGTNVEVSTTDDFTRGLDALVMVEAHLFFRLREMEGRNGQRDGNGGELGLAREQVQGAGVCPGCGVVGKLDDQHDMPQVARMKLVRVLQTHETPHIAAFLRRHIVLVTNQNALGPTRLGAFEAQLLLAARREHWVKCEPR